MEFDARSAVAALNRGRIALPPLGGGAIAALFLLLVLTPAHAVQPDEILKDPALEARARHLSQELRCLVCQNETLADSQADLAADLRREIRNKMKEGKTDKEIVAYLTAKYTDFVLYKPPVKPSTRRTLWSSPASSTDTPTSP